MPTRKRKVKQRNKRGGILAVLFLFATVIVTVIVLVQPQRLQQFASQGFQTPPMFGCIQMGEGSNDVCGTRLGESGKLVATLHGRPYNGETVYWGDVLTASYVYKNTADQPLQLRHMGIAAGAGRTARLAEFSPLQGPATIPPGKEMQIQEASFRFQSPDPNGIWVVGPGLTDTNGSSLPIESEKAINIPVSAHCTALRVKPLTEKDKSNIKEMCGKDSKSKLCSSRQYCEIFEGGECKQKNASEENPDASCNEWTVLDQGEQDILEELCKAHPDTDACKRFCDRSIGSKICPPIIFWYDKDNKKVVPKKAQYMASLPQEKKGVAGVGTGPGDNLLALGPAMWVKPPTLPSTGGPAPAKLKPLIKAGVPIGKPKATPGTPGYTPRPSCASHRQNDVGECCTSGYPLINGCCQPGCFVYHSNPLDRNNCPFKDKAGRCCATDAVVGSGYCQSSQAPKGADGLPKRITPGEVPQDPKIFPPQYIQKNPPPPATPGKTGGGDSGLSPCTKMKCSGGQACYVLADGSAECGNPKDGAKAPAANPPANPPVNPPANPPVPACAGEFQSPAAGLGCCEGLLRRAGSNICQKPEPKAVPNCAPGLKPAPDGYGCVGLPTCRADLVGACIGTPETCFCKSGEWKD